MSDLPSDFLDPADIDWTLVDESALFYGVLDGIPQAIAEDARRKAL